MPKLTLSQVEIVSAIQASVAAMGFDVKDKTITVVLSAGRKNNGHTAEVTISDAPFVSSACVVEQVATPRKTLDTQKAQVAAASLVEPEEPELSSVDTETTPASEPDDFFTEV